MNGNGISQGEPRKVAMSDDEIQSRLLAYIRKTWPEQSASETPDIEVVAIKEDPKSRNLRVTIVDRKKRRDQLNALLDQVWGPVQGEKPKTKIDSVMVDHLKDASPVTRSKELGSGKQVIQFPRAMKRGSKVRTGPCAQIIPLTGIYVGSELEERYEFARYSSREWQTTNTEGTQAVNWERRRWREAAFENAHNRPLNDQDKLKEVREGRARIDTRNRIKAYLERRGVNLDDIRNAEDALFALFGFIEAAS
jgi:hypothetical protein